MYERWLVPALFAPWAKALLDAARPVPGQAVLDVACGTGVVARCARERIGASSRLVGVDSSAAMLAVARDAAPDVEWREGDAAALPLREGERFDLVTCQQGLQFFADKPAALREMTRALAPGGRLAVSVWGGVDEAPFLATLHRLAERRLGPVVDRRHAFGDARALEALLRDAGLRELSVQPMKLRMRFPEPRMFLRMNALALLAMAPGGAQLAEDERARRLAGLEEDAVRLAAREQVNGVLEFDLCANLALARTVG
jgi:ubiquinone/menaquinone biosynthesis C-methylase UbiE